MNKIILRQLAISDLCLSFARRMEGNKIIHYTMSYLSKMMGADPEQLVTEFIRKTEPDAEIEFVKAPTHEGPFATPAFSFLDKEPKIKAALQKFQSYQQLYQYKLPATSLGKWIAVKMTLANLWNSAMAPLNKLLVKLQPHKVRKFVEDGVAEYMATEDVSTQFKLLISKLIVIPTFTKYFDDKNLLRVTPCLYHSVAYEEGDELIAEQAILSDLRIYQSYGAIMGHFVMPSRIKLADTIGSGKDRYALICFFFADFYKIPGWNPLLTKGVPSPFPGVRTAGFENQIVELPELDASTRYQIEVVSLVEDRREANLMAYHQSYLDSLPAVQAAVKKTQVLIDALKDQA